MTQNNCLCAQLWLFLQVEVREEGGTPAIVEGIRAGLAMKTKLAVGPALIMQREAAARKRAMATWRQIQELVILGPDSDSHLPVFSFLIRYHWVLIDCLTYEFQLKSSH